MFGSMRVTVPFAPCITILKVKGSPSISLARSMPVSVWFSLTCSDMSKAVGGVLGCTPGSTVMTSSLVWDSPSLSTAIS